MIVRTAKNLGNCAAYVLTSGVARSTVEHVSNTAGQRKRTPQSEHTEQIMSYVAYVETKSAEQREADRVADEQWMLDHSRYQPVEDPIPAHYYTAECGAASAH